MNYLAEIIAFNDSLETNQLSTGQIALWYALMSINNKCRWAEWFAVANRVLESKTGLSRKAILEARNVLQQKGYIKVRTNGTKASSYRMISLAKTTQAATQETTQAATQETTQVAAQETAILSKRDETKRNEKESKDARARFTPPTIDEVKSYCDERKNGISAEQFVDFYTSKGWMVGSAKMKDWRSAVRTWERRDRERVGAQNSAFLERQESLEEIRAKIEDPILKIMAETEGE